MKILILGCGNVGGDVAVQLASRHPHLQFLLGDYDRAIAESIAARIGAPAEAVRVDVTDPESVRAALSGADLVFNAVGPFYRHALPVIEAAIAAGVDYVDINDDHDVAARLVLDPSYHERATRAGIKILIGCGNTPGLTNVLARLGANRLDRVHAIRVCWIVPFVGGFFSPAVWNHLFHMVDGEVTQFLDGRYQKVAPFEGRRNVTFLPPFGSYPAYYSGHGEPLTLARFIPGVEEVTVRSCFFPQAGDDLWRHLVLLGLGSQERLANAGLSPFEFLMRYASSPAGQAALTVMPHEDPFGHAEQVEVEGERDGDSVRLVFEQHGFLDQGKAGTGQTEAGTDPTSTCARIMLDAVIRGDVKQKGVLAPEACIDAEWYVREVVRETGVILHEREEIIRNAHFAPNVGSG
jgi:saccharopine dehydrogenase-like NADP-dependent oxidoreductase